MLNSYDVAYFSSVLPAGLSLDSLVELRMLNYHFLPSSQGLARMPRLRVLRIWSCSLDWDSLGALVRGVAPTLRFVELRLTSWPTSNVPAMFRALSAVEDSLTMLAIRGSCGASPAALAAHLARFTALTYLRYDELFCARPVATPPALKRLALVTRMRTEAWDYARRLAEWLRSDAPPGLEELTVEVHSPRRRDVRVWKWLAFCLAARAALHGIRLSVLVVRGEHAPPPTLTLALVFDLPFLVGAVDSFQATVPPLLRPARARYQACRTPVRPSASTRSTGPRRSACSTRPSTGSDARATSSSRRSRAYSASPTSPLSSHNSWDGGPFYCTKRMSFRRTQRLHGADPTDFILWPSVFLLVVSCSLHYTWTSTGGGATLHATRTNQYMAQRAY